MTAGKKKHKRLRNAEHALPVRSLSALAFTERTKNVERELCVVSCADSTMLLCDLVNGKPRVRRQTPVQSHACCAAQDKVYFGGNDGIIRVSRLSAIRSMRRR